MSYPYYLCTPSIELNSAQAAAYGRAGWVPGSAEVRDCCECEGLAQALGYPDGWSTPEQDEAPWWDPTEPHSKDFGGLIIQSVTGLGPGRVERRVTDLAGSGSVIGRRQQSAPTIVVTGLLIGRTGCAVDYGLRWLRTGLLGECEGTGCGTTTLSFLDCCPPPPESEPCEGCPPPDPDTDWEAVFAPYWRTLQGVALVSDVEILEQLGQRCGCGCGYTPILRVQIILAAEQPCVYREPVIVHEDVRIYDNTEPIENCFTWIKVPDGGECPPGEDECHPGETCATGGCGGAPRPPALPIPINPCLSCTPFVQRKLCLEIPGDIVPAWATGVIGMRVFGGSAGLRHLRVRFYPNPLGLDVDELDPCIACSELNVSEIPPYSTFEIDAAARKTTITCPGSEPASAAALLGGPPGRIFSFPEVSCGGVPYTVCFEVDSLTVTRSATIELSVMAREC